MFYPIKFKTAKLFLTSQNLWFCFMKKSPPQDFFTNTLTISITYLGGKGSCIITVGPFLNYHLFCMLFVLPTVQPYWLTWLCVLVLDALLLRADDSASLVNQYTLHCTEVQFRMISKTDIFINSLFEWLYLFGFLIYCTSLYNFRGNVSYLKLEIVADSNSCHNILIFS